MHETPRRTEKRQMPADRPAVTRVLGAVWAPGLGLAFSSIGFGAITTFVLLLFVTRGWSPAWLDFTAFATASIAARVVFGHLPDKVGGARVALVCVLIDAAGLALIWLAPGAGLDSYPSDHGQDELHSR